MKIQTTDDEWVYGPGSLGRLVGAIEHQQAEKLIVLQLVHGASDNDTDGCIMYQQLPGLPAYEEVLRNEN
jgi:hypothetical protein